MITKGSSSSNYRSSSNMATTVILLLLSMLVTFPSSGWVSAQQTTTNTTNTTNTTKTTTTTNTTNTTNTTTTGNSTTNTTTNTTNTTSPNATIVSPTRSPVLVVAPTSLPAAAVTDPPTTTPTTLAPVAVVVTTPSPPPQGTSSSSGDGGCCSWTFNVCIEEESECASFLGCQACNGYWLPQKPQDPTCSGLFTECNGLNVDKCCNGLICTLANPNDTWKNCQVPVAETPMPSPSLPTLPPTSAPTLSPTFAGPPTLSTESLPFFQIRSMLRQLSIRNAFDQTVLQGAPRFSEEGLMEALKVMYAYGIGRQQYNDNTDDKNLEYHFYLGEPIPEDATEDERAALEHEYRYGLANLAMFLSQLVAQPDFFQANICSTEDDEETAMEEDDIANANDDLLNDLNETTALAEQVLRSTTSSSNSCGALGHTPLCNNNDPQQGRDCDTVYGIENDLCACVLGQLNAKLGIAQLDAMLQPRWVYYDDLDFCNVTAATNNNSTTMSSSVVCSYDKDVPEGPWLVPMASWILNVQRYVSADTGWNYQDELRALVDSEMDEDLKRILVARVAKLVAEGTHRIPFDPTFSDPSERTFDLVLSLYQRILPSIFEDPQSRLRKSGTVGGGHQHNWWWSSAAVLTTTLLAIVAR